MKTHYPRHLTANANSENILFLVVLILGVLLVCSAIAATVVYLCGRRQREPQIPFITVQFKIDDRLSVDDVKFAEEGVVVVDLRGQVLPRVEESSKEIQALVPAAMKSSFH